MQKFTSIKDLQQELSALCYRYAFILQENKLEQYDGVWRITAPKHLSVYLSNGKYIFSVYFLMREFTSIETFEISESLATKDEIKNLLQYILAVHGPDESEFPMYFLGHSSFVIELYDSEFYYVKPPYDDLDLTKIIVGLDQMQVECKYPAQYLPNGTLDGY